MARPGRAWVFVSCFGPRPSPSLRACHPSFFQTGGEFLHSINICFFPECKNSVRGVARLGVNSLLGRGLGDGWRVQGTEFFHLRVQIFIFRGRIQALSDSVPHRRTRWKLSSLARCASEGNTGPRK